MMANRDIVSEAVEKAEAMKAAAYEYAKNVLVEARKTTPEVSSWCSCTFHIIGNHKSIKINYYFSLD